MNIDSKFYFRKDVVVIVEDRRLEDILEEDNEDSDSNECPEVESR